MINGKWFFLLLTLLLCPALKAQEPIRVATIVPATGPLAEIGQASEAALKAYLDKLNSEGGISGRKFELLVVSTETSDIQKAARDPKVIALVGGMIAGHEKPIADVIRAEQVPLIGAATLLPPVDPPLNLYGFYIISGVKEQARALVNFAASKPELKNAPAAIVYIDDQLSAASANAAAEQASKLDWKPVTKTVQQANDFKAAALVEEFKKAGTKTIFFFGPDNALKELIRLSAASSFTPTFLTLGATAGSDFGGVVTPAFKDKLFLSFPTVPTDITARDEFLTLQQKYNLPAKHIAIQINTLAAAKVFIEALKRSWRNPSRATLITSLEGLQDFETGFSPRVTLTRDRRVGAAGAYMITFDPEIKNLVPASAWISAY
jgi:ABC-type branched-subunit amino acid transport system substrate-binding protein